MTWVWVAGIYQIEEHPYYASTVFDPVYDAGTCQDASFRQYLAGGRQNGQITSEVWMTVDGFRWTNQGEAAWDPVYKPSMTGDSAGTIYLAGGILDLNANPRRSSGAVWMSSSQGRSWRQVSTGYDPRTGMMTGPGERAVSILLSMPSNALLYMTGVNTGVGTGDRPESYQKDVWVSTNQGRAFDPINLNAPFGRRDDASAVVTVGGIVAMVGGYGGTGDGLQRQGQIYNVSSHRLIQRTRRAEKCWCCRLTRRLMLCALLRCRLSGRVGDTQRRLHMVSSPLHSRLSTPLYHLGRLFPVLTAVLRSCRVSVCRGLCVANAEWEDRRYQMTALDGDGYLWVMGGLTANGYLADSQHCHTISTRPSLLPSPLLFHC